MLLQENRIKQAQDQPLRAGSLTRTPSTSKVNGAVIKAKPDFSKSERQLLNKYLQNSGKSKLSSIVNQIKAKTPLASEGKKIFLSHSRNSSTKYIQESPFRAYELADEACENKENRPNKENVPQTSVKPQRIKAGKALFEKTLNKPSPGEEMKAVVKKIFMFYASFGDRLNSDYIKANKVYKMMHDALILDEGQLNKTSLDLLFCRFNKNRPNMSFEIFLSMLVNISQIKFPEQDRKQAFMLLFESHLKPLYDNLCTETDIGDHDKLFKEPLDHVTIEILNQARPTLQKIHQVYFPLEYQIKSENPEHQQLLKHKADQCLSSFLKDFEICPKILTNSTAYALYVEILETDFFLLAQNPDIPIITEHDVGHKFTLSKFLTYIARLAIIKTLKSCSNPSSDETPQQSNSEKLLSLLETLDLSAGYVNFEKQLNLTHNHTIRLLPNKSLLKRLTESAAEGFERVSLENQQSRIRRTPSELSFVKTIGIKSPQGSTLIQLPRSASFASPQHNNLGSRFSAVRPSSELFCNEIFDRRRTFLLKLFQDFASTNGNANTYRLKSIKFLKMLKNAELLQENTNISSQNTSATKNNGRTSQLSHTAKQGSLGGCQSPVTADPLAKIEDLKRNISTTDFDLIFIRVSGSNKETLQKSNSELNFDVLKSSFTSPKLSSEEGRLLLSHGKFLDFGQFLKALELITEKLYPEYSLDIALSYLIDTHLAKASTYSNGNAENMSNGITGIKRLVSLLKDNQIVDVLAKLKESLHPYFSFYADQTGCMNFDCFMKFCKDFSVFPDMFSRSKLMQLFYNLATLHPLLYQKSQGRNSYGAESCKQQEEADHQVIDENLFTEALALCATEIHDNVSLHPLEKILHLLDKMSQSPGPVKILKLQKNARTLSGSYFEVIDYIKSKYNNTADRDSQKTGVKTEIDITQIFS